MTKLKDAALRLSLTLDDGIDAIEGQIQAMKARDDAMDVPGRFFSLTARREDARQALEDAKDKKGKRGKDGAGELMSAEDFFGTCD